MASSRTRRHPVLVVSLTVAVLSVLGAVILRLWQRSVLGTSTNGPVSYSTNPLRHDPFAMSNAIGLAGLILTGLAVIAVTVAVVLALRVGIRASRRRPR